MEFVVATSLQYVGSLITCVHMPLLHYMLLYRLNFVILHMCIHLFFLMVFYFVY